MDKKKTIFIVITRGFIVRNILRSGGMEYLLKAGWKVVVFLEIVKVPDYILEEFKNDNVEIISTRDHSLGGIHRRVNSVTNFLIFTDSTKMYLKYGTKALAERMRIKTYAHIAFVWCIAHIPFLKPLMRWIDFRIFPEKNATIGQFFDIHNPDIVFSTSVVSSLDTAFMKEARRRSITTVSMPKGWDNVTKSYYRFIPDYFIVQNKILKEKAAKLQNLPKENIFTVGFPQFDWYSKENMFRSKEEHFKKHNLDPALPLIFFGSEGAWADQDYKVAIKIAEWIENNELSKKCQMLVRPHFTNVKEAYFQKFKDMSGTVLDESFTTSDVFIDNWDPTIPETTEFINSLKYCDIMITTISTLNLDAACFDKPLINLLFGGGNYKDKEDITPFLYYTEHMQWVIKTGALRLSHNIDELKQHINDYLNGVDNEMEGRERLRNELCYKIDGNSSERMVNVLDEILRKEKKQN